MYWLCRYLQNQVLLTSVPTGLIFYQSRVVGHFYVCWYPGIPLFPWVLQAVLGYQQFNKFNQLVARSIIVTHMKSIFVPSLTLKVYGPMRPHIIPPKGWWQQVLLATWGQLYGAQRLRMTKWHHFVCRPFGVPTDHIFWHTCRIFWHTCHISNLKILKSADFVIRNQKNVLVKKNEFQYRR
jgi:hypothetical protein